METKPTDSSSGNASEKEVNRDQSDSPSWRDYLPLIVIVTLAAGSAMAKQAAYPSAWDTGEWMHDFMGIFLVMFSMFKLFDLPGFADGFEMYDLLAKRVRIYGLVYPFLELGLGLAYLARFQLPFVYGFTILLMLFGAAGVISALRRDLDINCPCMGTVLKVPLSTVTLTEDFGMAAMAAIMLLI